MQELATYIYKTKMTFAQLEKPPSGGFSSNDVHFFRLTCQNMTKRTGQLSQDNRDGIACGMSAMTGLSGKNI
jgi:hypothetical protein